MITSKERTEKIRSAPSNSTRLFRKLSPQQKEEHIHRAVEHIGDAGMSASDEYAYLRAK